MVKGKDDRVSLPADVSSFCLMYQFDDLGACSSVAVQIDRTSTDSVYVTIADQCRRLEGGYSQHALNQNFAQLLFRHRPTTVVISGVNGSTVDLPRIAALFGVPVILLITESSEPVSDLSQDAQTWLCSSLSDCDFVLESCDAAALGWSDDLVGRASFSPTASVDSCLRQLAKNTYMATTFDYSMYEFTQRHHPLLVQMHQGDTVHFDGCSQVLDLACGSGIFLDCLRQKRIPARGVERDAHIACYARGMGLDVETSDALEYLESRHGEFDGIYCSHFVEHLPVELVRRLLELLFKSLAPSGVLVLVFPDPESIRSQLLGFWRDPEHVRFYHPELVIGMATAAGFELDWSSYDEQPHPVVPFHDEPQAMPVAETAPEIAQAPLTAGDGLLSRLLQGFGLASGSRMRQLEERLQRLSEELHRQVAHQQAATSALEARTATLWDVNRTWAWNDNATLRLRKPAR